MSVENVSSLDVFNVFRDALYQYPPSPFIRYSFDNVLYFKLFPSQQWMKREKYKIEYKSVLCQIHSIAIFLLSRPIIFLASTSGVLYFSFWTKMTGPTIQYFYQAQQQSNTALRKAKADAVYWMKLSMKYFDILNDSLFEVLWTARGSTRKWRLNDNLNFFF